MKPQEWPQATENIAIYEVYGHKEYLLRIEPKDADVIVELYVRITGDRDIKCIRNGKELPRSEIAPILARAEE